MCTNLFMHMPFIYPFLYFFIWVSTITYLIQLNTLTFKSIHSMITKLIPLSHLNVLYYLMLVSFKKQPVTKCDTEVACCVGGFGRATGSPVGFGRRPSWLSVSRPNLPVSSESKMAAKHSKDENHQNCLNCKLNQMPYSEKDRKSTKYTLT